MGAGPNDYVAKPVDMDELMAKLKEQIAIGS